MGKDHPHGYVRFKTQGCKCFTCRLGNADYAARRKRLMAYGSWEPYVDANPVREHIQRLSAAGIGWRRVSMLTGVPRSTMNKMIYGTSSAPPSVRVRPATAAAILALEPESTPLADGARVLAVGSARRVRALTTRGFSVSAQAERVGRTPGNFWRILIDRYVTVATDRRVLTLYDELWDQQAPDGYGRTRALAWADANRCFPPSAWCDETIGDPEALPCVLPPWPVLQNLNVDELRIQEIAAGFDVDPDAAERAEVGRRLMASGATLAEVAERFGVSRQAVQWWVKPKQPAVPGRGRGRPRKSEAAA